MRDEIIKWLNKILENKAMSCLMDFGCVTPIHVYRMWGGNVSLDEIEATMADVRRNKMRKVRVL